MIEPNKLKKIICEELININKDMDINDHTYFIPPTSIDWMGNRIALAIWEQLE